MIETLGVIRIEGHRLKGGRLGARGSFPSWLAAAAPHVNAFDLILPIEPAEGELGGSFLLRPSDRLRSVPPSHGYARGYLRFPLIVWRLLQLRSRTDTILCRAPEHLNALLLPALILLRFKIVIWLVADREEILAAELERRRSWSATLGGWINRGTGAVERLVLRRAKGVIANGRALAAWATRIGVSADRVLPVVSATIAPDAAARPPPAVSTNPLQIRLLYVGRIASEKGLRDLLEAVAKLRDEGLDFRLTIVGWSGHGELARLQSQAEALDIAGHLVFAGHVPHGEPLYQYYRSSDVFVLPSWIEGTPRVLVEAMTFGLPIVATDVGGIPDVVASGRNGLLVPPHSPGELAQAIRRLAEDPTMRRKISATNSTESSEYTADRLAEKMITFIRHVTAGNDVDA